jgi:hypothetical protein
MPVSPEDLNTVRAYAREQAAEAADLRLKVKFLEREHVIMKRRLDRVYRSYTWRVGRVVLFPIHIAQWAMAKLRRRGM